jgi:hypothetical protein
MEVLEQLLYRFHQIQSALVFPRVARGPGPVQPRSRPPPPSRIRGSGARGQPIAILEPLSILCELVDFLDQKHSQARLPVRVCVERDKFPEIDDPGFYPVVGQHFSTIGTIETSRHCRRPGLERPAPTCEGELGARPRQ